MGTRHCKHRKNRHSRHEGYDRTFRPGGGQWYRIPSQGYLAGVCAGFADYYDIAPLMARGLTVTAGLFMPQLVVILYIVAIFALPTRKKARENQAEREQSILDDIEQREERSRRRQRKFDEAYERADLDDSEPSLDSRRILIRRFKEKMAGLEGRLQDLERHVTSKRYDLAREIDEL